MQGLKKIYCGGTFNFDYRDKNFEQLVKKDYRVSILGNYELLLRNCESIKISDKVEYIGPFYFETNDMRAEDVINIEKEMIEKCTDAIFLLDSGLCPGTISELIYAATLLKNIFIFYIYLNNSEETESELHTPCWYPILLSNKININTKIYRCDSIEDAKRKINNIMLSF